MAYIVASFPVPYLGRQFNHRLKAIPSHTVFRRAGWEKKKAKIYDRTSATYLDLES